MQSKLLPSLPPASLPEKPWLAILEFNGVKYKVSIWFTQFIQFIKLLNTICKTLYTKPKVLNQICTLGTKPNLLNQIYQPQSTKLNLSSKMYEM